MHFHRAVTLGAIYGVWSFGCFSARGGMDDAVMTSTSEGDAGPGAGETGTTATDGATAGGASTEETGQVSDSSGEESGEPPEECSSDSICVGVPEGWQGPVLLMDEDSDGSCPSGYPTELWRGGSFLSAPAATCGCSCGELQGQYECGPARIRAYDAPEMQVCPNTLDIATWETSEDACVRLDELPRDTPIRFLNATADLSQAGCTPLPEIERPEVVWQQRSIACALPETESCLLGKCVPSPLPADLCVWQEGTETCPSRFPNQLNLFTGVEDQRDCTACTCGDPVGRCQVDVELFSGSACNISQGSIANLECLLPDVDLASARFSFGGPAANCEAGDVEPTGEVQPSEPVTVCCG